MSIDPNLKLYKYRQFSETSLRILKESRIWYAKPASFNDPFDTGFKPSETTESQYETFLNYWGSTELNLKGKSLDAYVSQAFAPSE